MPIYHETVAVLGRHADIRYRLRFYRQPRWRHELARGYTAYTNLAWRPALWLEGKLRAWHETECDCEAMFADEAAFCDYIPLTNRQDERAFDLTQAGRQPLVDIDITADAAEQLGWSLAWTAAETPSAGQ